MDARPTSEALAAEVGLSPAAVQRRLKQLRGSGVIARTVAVSAPAAVGPAMTFLIELQMERERVDLMDGFKRQKRATPGVQQCHYVTGDTDFVLVVTARDMADYDAFTRRVFFDNPNIRRFRTSVVMDRVEVGPTVPVEPGCAVARIARPPRHFPTTEAHVAAPRPRSSITASSWPGSTRPSRVAVPASSDWMAGSKAGHDGRVARPHHPSRTSPRIASVIATVPTLTRVTRITRSTTFSLWSANR